MLDLALLDCGIGNLHSATKALALAGASPRTVTTPQEALTAQALVLPGVGAFDPAMVKLREGGWHEVLPQAIAAGKPLLGICIGMQVLFDGSEEGQRPGLGLIPGQVRRFRSEPGLTIPHMGWNQLAWAQPDGPLWHGGDAQPWVYFVHSYAAQPGHPADVAATATHGHQTFVAAIARPPLFGVQFHPEKSAAVGLQILRNFVRYAESIYG
ncbi:MAG: imidazole glycerol phosphate synthase subunit HisH [Oscillatoriales cyanobacterium SM2_1_8]|nr:imidazole glycerol phosphate synthase subunit HisH [Oscillatoriales cyanobacterium SM2_1_8]